jgi:hypothetical protein
MVCFISLGWEIRTLVEEIIDWKNLRSKLRWLVSISADSGCPKYLDNSLKICSLV